MLITNETDIDWDSIDYGNCAVCSRALEEGEHAIGNVCSDCRPALMESYELSQDAEQERLNEERFYPEVSSGDYSCDYCGRNVYPPSWKCTYANCHADD